MGGAATARRDPRVLRLLGAEMAGDLGGRVVSGRELGRRNEERRRAAFATGLGALDELLGADVAGLPRGCLVELVGRASSGRFAAALSTLAAATAAGEAAALVDLGDHLDPEAVAAAGADPDRLLWVRPRDLREALAAVEAILAGGLPLVVLDLGLPPVRGGRGNEASWLRLARAADAHGAALLLSSPYRVSGTAAHAVVAAESATGLYAGAGGRQPLLQGVALRFTLEKLRGHRPGAVATTELVLPQVHPESGLVPSRRRPGVAAAGAVVHRFPAAGVVQGGCVQPPSAGKSVAFPASPPRPAAPVRTFGPGEPPAASPLRDPASRALATGHPDLHPAP